MLCGFAASLLGGFALTSVENGTHAKSVSPGARSALTVLWVRARWGGLLPTPGGRLLSAAVDCLFLPSVALLMARVLIKTGNRSNYMFIPFLGGLSLVNICFHLSLYQGRVAIARELI